MPAVLLPMLALGAAPLAADPLPVVPAVGAVTGTQEGERLGAAGAAADLDGDGIQDVVLTDLHREHEGGLPDGVAAVILGPLAGRLSLDDAAALLLPTASLPSFGLAVAAGDLDDDGLGDVAVTAKESVAVYFGPFDGDRIAPDLLVTPAAAGAGVGGAVAIGDVDGDGRGDLVVGAPLEDAGGVVDAGAVYVLFGPLGPGARILGEGAAAVMSGTWAGGRFGRTVVVGDLDADGRGEALVSAPLWGPGGWGAAFRFSPTRGATLTDGEALGRILGRRPALDCYRTFCEWAGSELGTAMAVADFDGDGRDDLALTGLIGVQDMEISVFLDPPRGRMRVEDADVVISRTPEIDLIDTRRLGAADLDGDGAAEVVGGALTSEPDQSGSAMMICPATRAAAGAIAEACRFVFVDYGDLRPFGALGDVDGDGLGELLACDDFGDQGGSNTGTCYAVPGARSAGAEVVVAP